MSDKPPKTFDYLFMNQGPNDSIDTRVTPYINNDTELVITLNDFICGLCNSPIENWHESLRETISEFLHRNGNALCVIIATNGVFETYFYPMALIMNTLGDSFNPMFVKFCQTVISEVDRHNEDMVLYLFDVFANIAEHNKLSQILRADSFLWKQFSDILDNASTFMDPALFR